MSNSPQPPSGRLSWNDTYEHDTQGPRSPCRTTVVENLPYALNYAANLAPQDHAVLFYDNLVAATEYFCAFLEEGIRRQEVTCFTGLESKRCSALFEQVGISVAELENCGYLRNLSTDDLYSTTEQSAWNDSGNANDTNSTGLNHDSPRARFIHIHGSLTQQNSTPHEIMENERKVHRFCSLLTTSICCYDAKRVVANSPAELLIELLKLHNHCFFQGIAMQTSKLIDPQRNAIYPKLRSP
jgi:hypothetical protein